MLLIRRDRLLFSPRHVVHGGLSVAESRAVARCQPQRPRLDLSSRCVRAIRFPNISPEVISWAVVYT